MIEIIRRSDSLRSNIATVDALGMKLGRFTRLVVAVSLATAACSVSEATPTTLGPPCETPGPHDGVPVLPAGLGILSLNEKIRSKVGSFVESFELRTDFAAAREVEVIGQTYEWNGAETLYRITDIEGGEWLGFDERKLSWMRQPDASWEFDPPAQYQLFNAGSISLAFAQSEYPAETPGGFEVEFVGSELIEDLCADHYHYEVEGELVGALTQMEQGSGDVWWEPEAGYALVIDSQFVTEQGSIDFLYGLSGINEPLDLAAYASEQLPDSAHLWADR